MFKSSTAAALLMALSTSLCVPVWSGDGAKGLFYEQLDRPAEHMNTGVQYWIELHRGDKVMNVNNKTAFHNGDRIRFHVKSNVDAFAYIILREGSGGEQAILFPDASHNDETKVVHGKDYSLPAQGFLTFDDHPGTERLLLLLSRTPVDATAYLDNTSNDRAQIAAVADGSKDLIPAKMVMAYEAPKDALKPKIEPASTLIASSDSGNSTPIKPASDDARPSPVKPTAAGNMHKPENRPVSADTKHGKPNAVHQASHKPVSSSEVAVENGGPAAGGSIEGGIVTVVHRDPGAVLALDLSLDHER